MFSSPSSGDEGSTDRPDYLLSTTGVPAEVEDQDEGGLEDILQVFKIFKLARVLKLARQVPISDLRINLRLKAV